MNISHNEIRSVLSYVNSRVDINVQVWKTYQNTLLRSLKDAPIYLYNLDTDWLSMSADEISATGVAMIEAGNLPNQSPLFRLPYPAMILAMYSYDARQLISTLVVEVAPQQFIGFPTVKYLQENELGAPSLLYTWETTVDQHGRLIHTFDSHRLNSQVSLSKAEIDSNGGDLASSVAGLIVLLATPGIEVQDNSKTKLIKRQKVSVRI